MPRFSYGVLCIFLYVGAEVAIGSLIVRGIVSGWSLLAIGLFNSIIFPTIFSLACEALGPRAAQELGGAVVPWITGHAADWLASLKIALAVPALCYAGILGFGLFARKPRPATDDSQVQSA